MSWVQTEQFACLCVQILIFCVQMVKCSKVTAHPVHHWEKRWQHATSLQCLLQCSHLSQPACTHKCPSCNKGESFEKVETNSKANSQLNQVGSVLVPFCCILWNRFLSSYSDSQRVRLLLKEKQMVYVAGISISKWNSSGFSQKMELSTVRKHFHFLHCCHINAVLSKYSHN